MPHILRSMSSHKSRRPSSTRVHNKLQAFYIKLAKFLQLIGTIFKKVIKETILKIHNTLVLPTFLYGSEIWTLGALKDEELKRQK